MDIRNQQDLYSAFNNADTILMKKYVEKIDEFPVIKPNDDLNRIKIGSNVELYHIDKIVYDKKESIHDKLTTVFSSFFSNKDSALVMILRGLSTGVDLYIGSISRNIVKDEQNNSITISKKELANQGKTLQGIFQGNFPGSKLRKVNIDPDPKIKDDETVESVINACFKDGKNIASVSGIAALRNHNENRSEDFVQGMEKLVDSMRGKEYAAIYIADVMSNSTIESICAEYEDIYTQLSPFKQSTKILSKNTSKTETNSIVRGIVDTTNESLAKSVTHGTTNSTTKTNTFGINIHGGGKLGPVNLGVGVNAQHSKAILEGITDTEGETSTQGKAKSLTEQNSVANALTDGIGESLQFSNENRSVRTLLERIDEHIKRLRSCEDFGLFDSCVYFISREYENAVSAASAYRSIIRGENSSVESSAINVWADIDQDSDIVNYLKRLYHPLFAMKIEGNTGFQIYDKEKNDQNAINILPVSPALMVSGRELSYQFSLPMKELSGLPVVECAEFGRNVMAVDGSYEGNLRIGNIYHMHQVEKSEVNLMRDGLTSHVFVTGSTGAGKSNSIYQLLKAATAKDNKDTAINSDITYMVIEPAKGEYKDVFGTIAGETKVYGTNPQVTPLLKINPFRFHEKTHIYEHMDRLVEIFNVCWPMFAAMPAILKAAIENAYISRGWDLEKSINRTGIKIYPTFATLALEVKRYLDSSEYSDENKGDYKGALLTRLESLTNGINGMIFASDGISDEELFDKNVIIDLSRVGSSETKALIMGILVMKLQGYRSNTSGRNSKLKHITVLEEAHNLLKRTSTEQSSENGNLLGKSVEMLANSIAEMRTYGEAFIIADQSPGLLDISVIRNTNTKIIFRLPEYSDRELVGRAANLNDEQIDEIARLKTGVAAVYQNNWISPVLCQFDKFEDDSNGGYKYDGSNGTGSDKSSQEITQDVLNIIMKYDIRKKLDDEDFKRAIISDIDSSDLPGLFKEKIIGYIINKDDPSKAKQIAEIAYQFFDAEDLLDDNANAEDLQSWMNSIIERLKPSVKGFDDRDIYSLLALLVHEHYLSHKTYEPIYRSYMEFIANNVHLK